MALLTKARPRGIAQQVVQDELVRTCVVATADGPRLWCEWNLVRSDGRTITRGGWVDVELQGPIIDADFIAKLKTASDNVHAKLLLEGIP